jgi:hypothetical protein
MNPDLTAVGCCIFRSNGNLIKLEILTENYIEACNLTRNHGTLTSKSGCPPPPPTLTKKEKQVYVEEIVKHCTCKVSIFVNCRSC